MRANRQSGSEGGVALNAPFLPLFKKSEMRTTAGEQTS
jgi:hypothetical protein